MGFGRSLELFFVNGNPDGILTAKVFNWTGHVLKAPRTQIREVLDRPEAEHTGVYLLVGEKDGEPAVYVGEGEVIADRIRQHDIKKDWWETVLFISTSANELNKAHVKYLESRIITLAQEAKSVALDNSNSPTLPKLGEAAIANMEEYLDTLRLVLPAIGVSLLVNRAATRPKLAESEPPLAEPQFRLHNRRRGIMANAKLKNGGFVVLSGSQASPVWDGSDVGYVKLYNKLFQDGIIDRSTDPPTFSSDYEFSSPSAAAAVCSGRSANGRIEWVEEGTGITYGDWEKDLVGVD